MTFCSLRRPVSQLVVSLTFLVHASVAAEEAPPPDRAEILRHSADGEDSFWQRIATDEPYASLGCRKIFTSAMAVCEARKHPERLQRLYEIAARFQDRDAESAGYGNLRWYWRDAEVTDRNAIEFCMQDALATWTHHRDWIPEPARSELFQLIRYGIEGCLCHGIPTRYTNIALLNAGNLIVSGETFNRPEAAEEGYRRLDAICHWTWRFGTCEFCSPTYYGAHDMPLTIDLPGDRRAVRCYFIPDGREDPYGKVRYATGSAGHRKALHLKPFWTAAQQTCDALGLVMFRDRELESDVVTNLQSHLVLRRENDGIWIGGQRVSLSGASQEKPARISVAAGDPLVLRYGTAAVGIRVLWARAQDGTPISSALVDDGNSHGAIRLTIDHHRELVTAQAGAAFWVRVGSGLGDDAAFEAWRTAFQAASPEAVETSENGIRLAVPGVDGPVILFAAAPFDGGSAVQLTPEPTDSPLELNGQDLGREMLENIEPICTYRDQMARLQPVVVPAQGGTRWEAEDGLVLPGMRVDEDAGASADQFVWHPKDSPVGSQTGSLTFHLDAETAGSYYLWARVFAPDPETDSFYVLQEDTGLRPPASSSWHTGNQAAWMWRCLKFNRAAGPTPLELPVGSSTLQFRVREAGTKIDRLFLTNDAEQLPE